MIIQNKFQYFLIKFIIIFLKTSNLNQKFLCSGCGSRTTLSVGYEPPMIFEYLYFKNSYPFHPPQISGVAADGFEPPTSRLWAWRADLCSKPQVPIDRFELTSPVLWELCSIYKPVKLYREILNFVAGRRIELLFSEWKSDVLTDIRTRQLYYYSNSIINISKNYKNKRYSFKLFF